MQFKYHFKEQFYNSAKGRGLFIYPCAGFLKPFLLPAMITMIFSACAGSRTTQPASPEVQHSPAADYSDLYYWAAHPYKKDPGDSTPKPYRNFEKDSSVDVFFLYPTSYVDGKLSDTSALEAGSEKVKWNAAINDEALNARTDHSSILFQASAFNHYRVFAPRYRQAHYQAFFINDTLSKPFFDTAYEDIKNAFRYYLQYYNNGRPFIIASHSQGTLHAARLIKDTIENTPLLNKMIAAYIIGLPVREDYFTQCLPCSEPTQTNCFVSWRTFRRNYIAPYITKENYKAVVVNPLMWRTDTAFAPKKLNHGAVMFKFNQPKMHAVSANIHGNILWVSKPRFFGSILYTRKNYHVGDINLFWKNIRDNVDDRVQAYKAAHPL